jgi:hypothetical protein
MTRAAINGLYAFGRGDPALEAIGQLLDAMKSGQMPAQAQPLADLPHSYEVVMHQARITYQDIPGGPIKVLTIERVGSVPP